MDTFFYNSQSRTYTMMNKIMNTVVLLMLLVVSAHCKAAYHKDTSPITSEEELKTAIMQFHADNGRIYDIYLFIVRNPEMIEHPEQIRSLLQNAKHRRIWYKKTIHSTDFSQRLKKVFEFTSKSSLFAALWCAGLSILFLDENCKEMFENTAACCCFSFIVSLAATCIIQAYSYLSYDTIDNLIIEKIDSCLDAF